MFRAIGLNFNSLYVRPAALAVTGVEFNQKLYSLGRH
jgi:hypothetical protein